MTRRLAAAALAAAIVLARGAFAQATATDTGGAPSAVALALSYTGEVATVASGGARRGTVFTGLAGAQVTVLLPRLVGWRGARVFAYVVDAHGGAPSDLV